MSQMIAWIPSRGGMFIWVSRVLFSVLVPLTVVRVGGVEGLCVGWLGADISRRRLVAWLSLRGVCTVGRVRRLGLLLSQLSEGFLRIVFGSLEKAGVVFFLIVFLPLFSGEGDVYCYCHY